MSVGPVSELVARVNKYYDNNPEIESLVSREDAVTLTVALFTSPPPNVSLATEDCQEMIWEVNLSDFPNSYQRALSKIAFEWQAVQISQPFVLVEKDQATLGLAITGAAIRIVN